MDRPRAQWKIMMAARGLCPQRQRPTSAVAPALSCAASVLPPPLRTNHPASASNRPSFRRPAGKRTDQCLLKLRTPRFADQTPSESFLTLLTEGHLPCSIRTSIDHGRSKYRSAPPASPSAIRSPIAGRASQSVCLDITKLMDRNGHFYLYVIIDISAAPQLSAAHEHAESAKPVHRNCSSHSLGKNAVTRISIHACRCAANESKTTPVLDGFGSQNPHSRLHTSNDNRSRKPMQNVENTT